MLVEVEGPLKGPWRAPCRLKIALQGTSTSTCSTLLPELEPLKGFFELTGRPLKGLQPRHVHCFRNLRTLEGLVWVDRPPFEGPSTLTRTLLPELTNPWRAFFELTGHPSNGLQPWHVLCFRSSRTLEGLFSQNSNKNYKLCHKMKKCLTVSSLCLRVVITHATSLSGCRLPKKV